MAKNAATEDTMIALPVRYSWHLPRKTLVAAPLGILLGVAVSLVDGLRAVGLIYIGVLAFFFLKFAVQQFFGLRYLELGKDAILIPSDFLHRRFARIPYAKIYWITDESQLNLRIRSELPKVEMRTDCLDREDLATIVGFLAPLAAKNMELRRQELIAHPEVDRRPVEKRINRKHDERSRGPTQLPDREAFSAYWKDYEAFRWRKTAPLALYLGCMILLGVIIKWMDPPGRLWLLECTIVIAYVILAPSITWRIDEKKHG